MPAYLRFAALLAAVAAPAAALAQEAEVVPRNLGVPPPTNRAAAIMARFANEPTAQELQDAALRFFRVHPEKIDSLRTSAEYKSLLPYVTASFYQDFDRANRDLDNFARRTDGAFSGFFFSEEELRRGEGLGYRVAAEWNLPRLVFNPEVLDVASLVGIQDGVLKEVTTMYYARRRMQVSMVLDPPADEATLIASQLRLEELTAIIDAMTGGYLSRRLRGEPAEQ
jgi:hypothetical protein